jgi:glycosyltransferase involved in cell wall biosynthesis
VGYGHKGENPCQPEYPRIGADSSHGSMPKVSVIIPNYNHARYLRQRIDTVLAQTYRDFEVIVLDDCSTDESRSIISEYASDPRVRIEFNRTNSGSTFKQWNKGVGLASGEYIWIAESDDYADHKLLERLVGVLDAEPEVTFAYCRSWQISEEGQPNGFAADDFLDLIDARRWKADFVADGREECRQYFVCANTVPNGSAVVFRRSVYERVGGADERFLVCGDWKLWVLMALEGRIAYLSEPLNYYREHDSTVRTKMEKKGRGAGEHLVMVRWMIERVNPPKAVVEKACACAGAIWIYAVLNRRIPFRLRWAILRRAMATDAHALRRLIRPAMTSLRLKLAKEFRLMRQRFEGRPS